jgi:integrase
MSSKFDVTLLCGKYSEETRKRYADAVRVFVRWCGDNSKTMTLKNIDRLVFEYVSDMYNCSDGKRGKFLARATVYGVIMIFPELSSWPYAKRALQSWDRLRPARQHPPLTWNLSVAIALVMRMWGYERHAVGLLLAFDCMLRVGELCRLHKGDVGVDDDARLGAPGVLLPVLCLRRTKTGVNQSVRVRDVRVATLLSGITDHTDSRSLLFPFTPVSFRLLLRRACSHLGLSAPYVPHSLRHGGATYMYRSGVPVDDIMHRGRWTSSKSVKRYIQDGEARLLRVSVPSSVASVAASAAADLLSHFAYAATHCVGWKRRSKRRL